MNINQAFPSKFLKVSDLQGRRIPVTISHVEVEEMPGDDNETKPVVYFQGKDKGLVLNRTNADAIVHLTGSEETEQWAGKRILLIPARAQYKGKMVDAIRIDAAGPAAPAPQAPPPPPVAPALYAPFDDEVPF